MNVLSLFDGISCAYIGLRKAGIEVKSYYAAEIDKSAIEISKKNVPCRIDVGDVREITELPVEIDLLIGGSPCQDLSIAKKGRQGLAGNRSSLFWEYVRILKAIKPKYFVLENVASMPVADKQVITEALGVEPIMINAALVSAQSRKRLFWTNIPNVALPEDRGILLKDILQPDAEVDEKYITKTGKSFCLTASYKSTSQFPKEAEAEREVGRKQRTLVFHKTAQTGRNDTKKLGYVGEHDHQAKRVYHEEGKAPALNVVCNSLVQIGYVGNTNSQGNRVYDTNGKSVSLSANGGGRGAKTGLYKVGFVGEGEQYGQGGQAHRVYSAEGKTPTLSSFAPLVMSGRDVGRRLNEEGHRDDDNKDLPVQRRIELREDGKSGTLTSVLKDNLVVEEHRIRKLTPIECERLQGLPDGYTEGIANTNRYKCLGNAFNVDVIAHILSHIDFRA